MRKLLLLLSAVLLSLVCVACLSAATAAPDVTVQTKTATTITLGSLQCDTRYKIRVQKFNADGSLSATTTRKTMTLACDPPPPPVTEPAPIAGLGYTEKFRDDFNTLDRSVWSDHIWYDGSPPAAWTGFQTVENGELHLRTSRNYYWGSGPDDNWPINTVSTQDAGITFNGGYFEARMKWTGEQGAWPGFWLFSYRHATNPDWPNLNPYCADNGLPAAECYSAELDAFEGQGVEPNVFYGTIHRNSSNTYGVPNEQNSNNYQPQASDFSGEFHTYGMLWEPTKISWFLDGVKLHEAPVYDSTNQPMFVLFQMWVGGWTEWPGASTPDVLETVVDYVSIWQKP